MKLFDDCSNFPPGLRSIQLDSQLDFDSRVRIFSEFVSCLRNFSRLVYRRHLPDFNIKTGPEYLFLPHKQLPNILLKTIILQNIFEKRRELIDIECFHEELDFFDNENISRFASIYALIGKHIPEIFTITDLGLYPNLAPPVKGALPRNPLLRVINLQPSIIWQKFYTTFFSTDFLARKKPTLLVSGHSGLYLEILAKLRNDFRCYSVRNTLLDLYDASEMDQPLHHCDLEVAFEAAFGKFLNTVLPMSLFSTAFGSIFLTIVAQKMNRLISSAPAILTAVGELKAQFHSSVFLCDGLPGNVGLAIYNAMAGQGITVVTAEHGLTAGIQEMRLTNINSTEPRTTDVMLCYNKGGVAVFQSSKNKNLHSVNCGAPRETKHIAFPRLQRFLVRRSLGAKGPTVFFVSTNLLANNNGYFPKNSPDLVRYQSEKLILQGVLPFLNKTVVYKSYPSQNYLYKTHPFTDLLPAGSRTIISGNEDFRYLRAASDIIVTSAPTSTLGWAIGTRKPLVYLHSRKYNPVQDDYVTSVFRECFFFFDTSDSDWVSRLVEFLNQPMVRIEELWQEMLHRQLTHENYFLLGRAQNAGLIGADYIRKLVRL